MNKKRLTAVLSAGAILISQIPASTVSAEALPPYPMWVPSTYTDALQFINEYGATRLDDSEYWENVFCVVNRFIRPDDGSIMEPTIQAQGDAELLSTARYCIELPDISYLGDPAYPYAEEVYASQLEALGLNEEMLADQAYIDNIEFDVSVYQMKPGGSAEINTKSNYSSKTYTFECSEDGKVTETDVFGWLPDCIAEYNDFRMRYPTVSAQHGYIALCTDYAGDGGYDVFTEIEGPAEFYKDVQPSQLTLTPYEGGTSHLVRLIKPTGEGTVHVTFSENQQWRIGEQEPAHQYTGDFEITQNCDDYELTDIGWWKDHEHSTFYKDGSDNGGGFYGPKVPDTFYDEPVEKAVITNMYNTTTITLPDCVNDVDIRGCTSLYTIFISRTNPYFVTYGFDAKKGYALFTKDKSRIVFCPQDISIENITLPEETTAIGKGAFRENTSVKTIVAANVTEIGEDAFEGCSGLTLYVSNENYASIAEQLGEDFTAAGNSLFPINGNDTKDWSYFCSLTDEEVLEEFYKTLRPDPTGDICIKDGIIYGDRIRNMNFDIVYRLTDPEVLVLSKTGYRGDEQLTGSPSSFGFPEDSEVRLTHDAKGDVTVYIKDDRQGSNSAYDFLRRQLTLYNSVFYNAYKTDESRISQFNLNIYQRIEFYAGDANGDAQVNLNDAVTILQQIALPEKYPIGERSADLADCDGNYGISGMDALAIQEYDAGTRDYLYLSYDPELTFCIE